MVPQTIVKPIPILDDDALEDDADAEIQPILDALVAQAIPAANVQAEIETLYGQMREAADHEAFEEAAEIRDRMRSLEAALIASGVE